MKEIKKRFPAYTNTCSQYFLNDKKLNGELYAVLLANSIVRVNEDTQQTTTYCPKEKINLSALCKEQCFNCTRQTLANKLKYLETCGYIKSDSKGYTILMPEMAWKDIPLSTVRLLVTLFQAPVIKTYIYLGVRLNWKKQNDCDYYDFSKKEIIEHCGIMMKRNREGYYAVTAILTTLADAELIKYHIVRKHLPNSNMYFYNYRLTEWSDTPKTYTDKNIKIEDVYEDVDTSQADQLYQYDPSTVREYIWRPNTW